jgi:nicotinate-nucleotide adenylyltransferase
VIAVFGGTFDPPHLGHAEAIQGVFEDPGCDRLWVLPCGNPVGKTPTLSAQKRLELAHLAFDDLKAPGPVEVLDLEVRWAEKNPGEISTTWKILPELERKAQGESLAWVIGTDQLLSLERWDRFPEVLKRIHWIVLERAGLTSNHGEPDAVQKLLGRWQSQGLLKVGQKPGRGGRTGFTNLRLASTRARAVSSTQIRESFARSGKAPEGVLDPRVAAHLKLQALYGSA